MVPIDSSSNFQKNDISLNNFEKFCKKLFAKNSKRVIFGFLLTTFYRNFMVEQINTVLLEISRAINWYQNYKMKLSTFLKNERLKTFFVVKS